MKLTSQELGNVGGDIDRWISDAEELVDESSNTREDDTNDPNSEGERGHIHVVPVVHVRSDLGVGRVLSDEQSLELHLDNEVGVFVGFVDDLRIIQEEIHLFHRRAREVLIVLMKPSHLLHDLSMESAS
jgi:hypothetical protein